MDGGVEGLLNLGDVSGEDDDVAGGRDFIDGESLGLEPCGDGGEVGVADAVAPAELGGSEPLAVVGRVGVLEVAEVLPEGLLLGVTAFEDEHDASGGHGAGRRSLIELRFGQRMHVVREGDALVRIDGLRDPVRDDDGFRLRLRESRGSEGEQPGGYERGQTGDGTRGAVYLTWPSCE